MRSALISAILGLSLSATGAGAEQEKVVIELFTSQGCSSCPPADAMLRELAGRDDVIALALHVDYWDYIGWEDSFAEPAFTQRQKGYARAAGERIVYTPQMIVGGTDHVVGTRPMEIATLIDTHSEVETGVELDLRVEGDTVHVRAEGDAGPLVVQVARFDPIETVEIHRGENAGRTIDYANIVTSWEAIGQWDGAEPFEAEVPRGESPMAVILQRPGHGAILAAADVE
ncbi:DUF1223 domain-containing protein [Histidinibacterium aquaticum]|uniref:DUF1223 domain-containing protein n=1 Tax=Histidinibacterium aquaticum TaxID=2613962 RepID=A0A5J5GM80_9RHOB|nr:DUF1223 domain-containing protein [Histidinibacterium aquaticum]KAA9009270.1 DUF1223 domain-containing protein [Histidinibacterium aquaticum]